MKKNACVIFGGLGYVGLFLAKNIIELKLYDKVFLTDILTVDDISIYRQNLIKNLDYEYQRVDVREEISINTNCEISTIFNLAAIHREPGHKPHEYFKTNIRGAENVCTFASKVNCNNVIFVSSISPYGPSSKTRNEESLTMPNTPYGISKLIAEKIHCEWNKSNDKNKLIIFRPGVIFGPDENGNMGRMIKAIKKNIFIYTGNKNLKKAGIYIKEFINIILWSLNINQNTQEVINVTFEPCPKICDYEFAIKHALKKNTFTPSLPFFLILLISYIITFFTKLLRIKDFLHPVRVRKLLISNDIEASFLKNNEFKFNYDLQNAFEDWKKELPSDWN